jgi:hypothetical protein
MSNRRAHKPCETDVGVSGFCILECGADFCAKTSGLLIGGTPLFLQPYRKFAIFVYLFARPSAKNSIHNRGFEFKDFIL